MPCCVPGSTRSTAVYCHASSWTCLCHRPSTIWILKSEGFIIIWCCFFCSTSSHLITALLLSGASDAQTNGRRSKERCHSSWPITGWHGTIHDWQQGWGNPIGGIHGRMVTSPGHNKLSARRQCDDEYPVSF